MRAAIENSLLRVVSCCVTSFFTRFWFTCWEIVTLWREGQKRNLFLQEHSSCTRNSWKSTLEKMEYGKEFLFFCRNLEVIPWNSWIWVAKIKERKKECTTLLQL
jgi:hypothetical protein